MPFARLTVRNNLSIAFGTLVAVVLIVSVRAINALAEESAAAANSLKRQARKLAELGGTFQLDGAPKAAPLPAPAKPLVRRAVAHVRPRAGFPGTGPARVGAAGAHADGAWELC